jgi:hypothetical protein
MMVTNMKLLIALAILHCALVVGHGSIAADSQVRGDRGKRCTSTVRMVKVVRPNIVVYGSCLSRVEVWVEPTGTGVRESVIGEAKRVGRAGAHEKWIFAISQLTGYPHAIMAVNLFAKGYDARGKVIGSKSLGFNAPGELNEALYGRIPE